jgi:hypothetical protein
MRRATRTLHLAALFLVLTAATAAAQQTTPTKSAPPATISAKSDGTSERLLSASARIQQTWDQTKATTRKEWDAAKREWVTERVRWRDCNRKVDAEKLTAPKSWSFIAGCMAGS